MLSEKLRTYILREFVEKANKTTVCEVFRGRIDKVFAILNVYKTKLESLGGTHKFYIYSIISIKESFAQIAQKADAELQAEFAPHLDFFTKDALAGNSSAVEILTQLARGALGRSLVLREDVRSLCSNNIPN